jgi:hypothetical protein
MENLENFIYSTFHVLISKNNVSLMHFFQKFSDWEIASWAKKNCLEKGLKTDKVVISRLLQILVGALV